MSETDPTDRRLLAELRRDARQSVSALAQRLGLSRATVRTRLDRLTETGIIARFTVELSSAEDLAQVRAVVLIQLEGSMSRQVIRALGDMAEIVDLHSTNGAWDLVARLECASLRHFDQALRRIREVKGVTNSESCLLLDRVG